MGGRSKTKTKNGTRMTKEMLENGGKKEEENPTLIHSKQQKGGKNEIKKGVGEGRGNNNSNNKDSEVQQLRR